LRAEYDARADEFNVPARRLVERLGFADDAAAQAAKAAIDAGESDFDTLLAERNLTIADVDLGFAELGDLGDAGTAIFALQDTGVVGPLPSPVGPALFRVNAILNAQSTPFDDARDALRADLARDRAGNILGSEVEPLNDLLAGGATLEDIAAESEMELGKIAWRGPGDGIAQYDAFNTAAQAVTPDDFPEIMVAEDGSIFALRLDEIVPPRVPALDDIREEVTAATRAAAIRAALAVQAEDMVARLSEGTGFDTLGLSSVTRDGISRRSGAEGLPFQTLEAIFDMEAGQARLIDAGAEIVVLRLDSVTQPDQNAPNAQALRAALTDQAGQEMAQEVLTRLARAIEAEAGISINQAALNAVHTQIQ
jgi:peptidyl-prolyl cis-trans isomerase D